MVRGRTTAPPGLILGHEITGEVIEVGPDVEFIKVGDLVSVPFNIACGRCANCKEGKTGTFKENVSFFSFDIHIGMDPQSQVSLISFLFRNMSQCESLTSWCCLWVSSITLQNK
jgi:threonine dehydrogenase-like Zn-dependent dehydrogenase